MEGTLDWRLLRLGASILDMTRSILFPLLFLFAVCGPAQAQFKPSSTCKFLTPEEASAVIGPGAKLVRAIEDGGCTYRQGPLTLDIAQPARMSDLKVLTMAFESSSGGGKATPVAGVGERAHIKKGNSGYQLMFLKGDGMGGVSVYGDGSDGAEMAQKLTAAAKKVAARF
jgi:hypothetical protein